MMQQIVKLSEEQMKFQAEIRTSMSNRYGYSDRGEGSTPRGPQGGKRPPADPPYSDSGGGMRRNTPLAASDTGQHQAGANWRYRKLDMPLFDGANPDGWILRAERYFNFYRLNEEEKVEAAVVSLEGGALFWYQWEGRLNPIRTWEEMKILLRREFRSTHNGSLHEQWMAVSQTGTVAEYRKAFIERAAPLTNIPEEFSMGHFINGLKEPIRTELRLHGPRNLQMPMNLALKIEEKTKLLGQPWSEGKGYWNSNRGRAQNTPSAIKQTLQNTEPYLLNSSSSSQPTPSKHTSPHLTQNQIGGRGGCITA